MVESVHCRRGPHWMLARVVRSYPLTCWEEFALAHQGVLVVRVILVAWLHNETDWAYAYIALQVASFESTSRCNRYVSSLVCVRVTFMHMTSRGCLLFGDLEHRPDSPALFYPCSRGVQGIVNTDQRSVVCRSLVSRGWDRHTTPITQSPNIYGNYWRFTDFDTCLCQLERMHTCGSLRPCTVYQVRLDLFVRGSFEIEGHAHYCVFTVELLLYAILRVMFGLILPSRSQTSR